MGEAAVMLLTRNGRFLLLRRSATDPRFPGWWCLPGGGMEAGERPVDAAVRETAEETSIRVSPASVKPLGVFKENDYTIHMFKAPARS